MTLQELLAQAADDVEISFGDQKIKAGEVKKFIGGVETERRNYETQRQKAERLAQEAQGIMESLTKAQQEIESQRAPKEVKKDDWRKNPLYEELVPILDMAAQAAEEARNVAKSTKAELDKASALYAVERMRNEYERASNKPKDRRFEDLVTEAIQAKEFDQYGMPTLAKALDRYNLPDLIKSKQEEAVAAARKEWEQKQRISETSKPGKFQTRAKGEAPIKNINDLTSDLLANDPEITKIMNGEAV